MKNFLLFLLSSLFLMAKLPAQQLDRLQAPDSVENVWIKPLYSDSLLSSFLIIVKQGVPAHYHQAHTETIYVLEGEGKMSLNDSSFLVGPGLHLSIPGGTVHSVQTIGNVPLKVLSIQAPYFDGTDRVWVEKK